MALSSTIYNFDIDLSNVDRGVYESLSLRVACHPSETPEHLLTRVLAYCLEYTEGIAFGKGLSEPNEPAIAVRDLTGALTVWIDVGSPDASRLHKASLTGPRVVVYTHKEPRLLLAQLNSERIHKSDQVEIYSFDRDMLSALVEMLDRRLKMSLSISDSELYITINDVTINGSVERHNLGEE